MAKDIADITLLHPEPGDVIVVTVGRPISAEEADTMHRQAQALFPEHKIAVVPSEIELSAEPNVEGLIERIREYVS